MKIKPASIVLVILAFFLGVIVYSALREANIPLLSMFSKGGISGELDVNGVIPSGATVTLNEKEMGSNNEFTPFATGIDVVDQGKWNFADATHGKSYEIQAEVIVNGDIITTSSPITVTAPATDESLVLNIESDAKGSATLSGSVAVSGYIPEGATVTIQGRELGDTSFETFVSGIAAQAATPFSYDQAVAGLTYELQAQLINASGSIMGTSPAFSAAAPAANEALSINSSATPPSAAPAATSAPVTTAISGVIDFNGAAPANSRIVILQHGANSTDFEVAVDNITPTNGTTWTWTGAENATWYTLVAVLKQRNSNGTDTDIADSTPIQIAAPASNVTFTINSGVGLASPGGPITITCQTYNGGPNQNNWNVQVMFQTVPGAQSYWFQVGSTNGGSDIVNTTNNGNPSNSQQQISATFNNNTTYYARYAYANVANQGTGSSQYSGFSGTAPLQCSH